MVKDNNDDLSAGNDAPSFDDSPKSRKNGVIDSVSTSASSAASTSGDSTTTDNSERPPVDKITLDGHDVENLDDNAIEMGVGILTKRKATKDDGHGVTSHNKNSVANKKKSLLQEWSELTALLRQPLLRGMVNMAKFSARYPVQVITFVVIFSISVALTGLCTNFYVETAEPVLWSPPKSATSKNVHWVNKESGFPDLEPSMVALIKADGENTLTVEAMEKAFEAFDTVRNLDSYKALCGPKLSCAAKSPTGFWPNHNITEFRDDVATDAGVRLELSSFLFDDGAVVTRELILGSCRPQLSVKEFQTFLQVQTLLQNQRGDGNNEEGSDPVRGPDPYTDVLRKASTKYMVEDAKSLLLDWGIPVKNKDPEIEKEALALEAEAIEVLLDLNKKWSNEYEADPDKVKYKFSISVATEESRATELIRGIMKDIPILAAAFFMMMVFCLYSLSKGHRVKSHSAVGIGAVMTIAFSIMSGYGIMFIAGYPLTTLTYLFPYGMMGLGLDAAFILMGQFGYTNPNLDIVDRIEDMVEEVGLSIAVSTLTTCAAYMLGSLTNMMGLRWFCMYASLTVFINVVYMMTFFIAVIVVDDRRIKDNRLDILVCFKAKDIDTDAPENNKTHEEIIRDEEERLKNLLSNRIMDKYSRLLMQPAVKAFVIFFFTFLAAGSSYVASGIGQNLDYTQMFPEDSYVLDYFKDIDEYSDLMDFYVSAVYFRDVDVSNPEIQDQMLDYVNDMVALPYISSTPLTFWLRDFQFWKVMNKTIAAMDDDFDAQIDIFLGTEPYKSLYASSIVRAENGTILASRTMILFDQLEQGNVEMEVDAFRSQSDMAANHPINKDSGDMLRFFTFGKFYFVWELWSILFGEILMTVALSLCALLIICLVFVSHPLAAFILAPTVLAIYVEIIAVYRISGLSINALTAIGLICCLGLVMDYATHVCITYFEIQNAKDRDERVRKVITCMGKSILKGGFTTFLGVLFVSWNEELAFRTIFITFIGITTLGVGHGLIFIPVVLSLLGPMDDCNTDENHIRGSEFEKCLIGAEDETSAEDEAETDLAACDSGLTRLASNLSGLSDSNGEITVTLESNR